MPTPPPSHTRRMFGVHLSTSRQGVDRLSSPRSRLSTPRSQTARPYRQSADAHPTHRSFAAAYAQQRRWKGMVTPPVSDACRHVCRTPLSAPAQLMQVRGGLASTGDHRTDSDERDEGGAPRPHTSDLTAGTASDAAQGSQLADGPRTWDWGEAAGAAGPVVGEAANAAPRDSISSRAVRLHEEGSWFDQDAWSRIKAQRALRKASQQELQEQQWRVAVRPWLAQKKLDNRETEVQKRLRRARKEQSELRRRLDETKDAKRHLVHALLKDMRSLLSSDALTGMMTPKQEKFLDRWVDDMMMRHNISQSLMDQVEDMHENLIRQLFESIDEDDSGLLDKDEVRQLASKLGAYRASIVQLHCKLLTSFRYTILLCSIFDVAPHRQATTLMSDGLGGAMQAQD